MGKCRHGRPECECQSRTLVCKHPYVSRAWIGYSGYCHCYACGNIVEDERIDDMPDWHSEVMENESEYLVDGTIFEGHQIDSDCCFKCDTSGHWNNESEHGKIDAYEAKNYTLGCRICGTLTGEHGFSFGSGKVG